MFAYIDCYLNLIKTNYGLRQIGLCWTTADYTALHCPHQTSRSTRRNSPYRRRDWDEALHALLYCDVSTSRDGLKTETLRSRDRDHIPANSSLFVRGSSVTIHHSIQSFTPRLKLTCSTSNYLRQVNEDTVFIGLCVCVCTRARAQRTGQSDSWSVKR